MNFRIERVDGLPFGRAYKVFKEKETYYLPSVTTILSQRKDPFLDKLKNDLGEKRLQELAERAARRGSLMHKLLENFITMYSLTKNHEQSLLESQKQTLEDPEFQDWKMKYPYEYEVGKKLFFNIYHSRFWEEIKEVLHNELFLYTLFKGGWAGATDFVFLNHEDNIVVIDFKTSSVVKHEDNITNYFMQISSYMFMYAEMYQKIPSKGEIWISNEKDTCIQKFVVEKSQFKDYLKQFIELRNQFESKPEWVDFKNSLKQ